MSTEREDLELQIEWLDLKEAFIAAKETRDTDPDGYAAAKAAMSEFRTKWRGVRDFAGAPGDAVATPATVGLTSTIQEG